MAALNIQAFPGHFHSFEGVATAVPFADKTYNLVHANELGTVTVTFEEGDKVFNMGAGEDMSFPAGIYVSSTMEIKVS